jgi:hypothetical protein
VHLSYDFEMKFDFLVSVLPCLQFIEVRFPINSPLNQFFLHSLLFQAFVSIIYKCHIIDTNYMTFA